MSVTTVASPSAAAARTRLLLEGPIAATLARLAAPNLVVNVVLITITTGVDAYFIGRLGPEALAGLALVFPMLMLMQQMANFSMGGALAGAVARAIGAGRRDDANVLVLHGLIIGALVAAAFSAIFLLGGRALYAAMGGSGAVLEAAMAYSNAIFAGAFAYWLLSTLTSAVRGTGQVATLAWVYVAAELLHVGLVPLLMFGGGPVPPLGIAGAGVATVIAFTCSSSFLAGWLAWGRTPIRLSLAGVRLSARQFADILRTGAPLSLQPILNNLALAILTFYAGMLGAAALAGVGAAVRLEYLMYPLVFGLGAAVVAMVGTNIGAGRRERALRIAWVASAMAAAVTCVVGLVAIHWPRAWILVFTEADDVARNGAAYLVVAALGYAFIGMNTLTQAFQAMNQTFWPMMAVVARAGVLVVGGWLVVTQTDWGVTGLAAVTAAGLVLAGVLVAAAFWAKDEDDMTLSLTGYVELPAHKGQGGFDHAAVHAASGHVYVAHTANDAIDVFDPAVGRYLYSVLGLAGVAGALVSDEADLVFSSNRAGNTIGVFAPGPNPTVRYAGVGMRPNGLAYDHRRKLLLAANVGEPYTLSMIQLDAGVRTEIAVPGRTRWSLYDPGLDRFFVNISEPSQIVVVDPTLVETARTIAVPHAGAHGLDIDPVSKRLFCACDAAILVALDSRTGQVLAEEKLSGVPDVVWFNAQRQQLYVAVGDPGVVDVFSTAPPGGAPLRRLQTVETERGAHTTAYAAAAQQLHVFLPQTHRAATYRIAT